MKRLASLALFAVVAGANAALVYSNIAGGTFTSGASPRTNMLDDFTLAAGQENKVTGFNFGFSNTATSFDVLVQFWDTVDFGAASGAAVVTGNVGGFILQYRDLAAGTYTSGMISLTGLPGGGITLNDRDGAVQVAFLNPGTNTLLANNGGTMLFAGGGVSTGASQDVYWRDTQPDGNFTGEEARFFSGPPNLANFYMEIEAVPEPGTMIALGLGLAAVAARRRKQA